MSKAQAKAYAKIAEYRLERHDLQDYFSSSGTTHFVEIGFGNGEILTHVAAQNPTWRCLGIDVYRPGIGSLITRCEREKLKNVRIIEEEATAVLESIPNTSIDVLFVLFPDPWPKKRHHRRRLVNTEFVTLTRRKVSVRGIVYIATDAADYATQIQEVMGARFARVELERIEPVPNTRYRQKALDAGYPIWDLAYTCDDKHGQPSDPSEA